MNTFSRDELKVLMQNRAGLCVSIFTPTHPSGAESQADRIRFKRALKEAEERLLAHGLNHPETEEFLAPARKLTEGGLFWLDQRNGLALFLTPQLFRYYHVPLAVEESVTVAQHFYVKPLLPLLNGDGRFYVLALSQNQVRLFQGTRYHASEIPLNGIPGSLAEALQDEEYEKQRQFRSSGSVVTGSRPGIMVYSQETRADVAKDEILRYFRQLDAGLHTLLKEEQAPLVLAGVEYLFPLYRSVNSYPHLAEQGIAGNPEELSPQVLHEKGWAIVQPGFLAVREKAAAEYRQWAATERASNQIGQIVPAAYSGQVAVLFVANTFQQPGTFDPEANTVSLHLEARPGDEDLANVAAIQTLLNRGTVYVVGPEEMPDHAPVAAVFRY